MGIPYFYYAIYRKYHNESKFVMRESEIGESVKVDHLFFDYNSLIHPCARKVISLENSVDSLVDLTDTLEDRIIDECIVYTRYIMSLIGARNVYVMIDGVAPMAKIHQQRERRYKSWFFKADKSMWDTNKITPGTSFMEKLGQALKERLSECVISGADQPGEGEHKMMKVIGQLPANSRICIYGLDADLIMLSLLSERRDDIILLRDQTDGQSGEVTYTYVDVGKLAMALVNELRGQCVAVDKSVLIWDFVVLCFLLGNDFLEHIPSLVIRENGVNVLIKAYQKWNNKGTSRLVNVMPTVSSPNHLGAGAVPSRVINIQMLTNIFGELASTEEYFFKKVKKGVQWKETQDLGGIQNVVFLKDDYIGYKSNRDYKKRYYSYYGIKDTNVACRDYMEGLYWVTGYYAMHKHDNWSWYYSHNNTPFVSDIYRYLKTQGNELTRYIEESKYLMRSEPITPMLQLTLVLPRDSLVGILGDDVVAQRLKRLLMTESKSVTSLFPGTIVVDLFEREYLWQSKVFFGEITGTPNFFLSC